jgi:hypothetical protein
MNEVQRLRDRIAEIEDELRELKQSVVKIEGVLPKILSKQQSALLAAIMKLEIAPYSQLDYVTEDNGKYDRYGGEMHQTLRTKVAVWKLRKKLKPYGIKIRTLRGVGYFMDDKNKAKLKQLMERRDD